MLVGRVGIIKRQKTGRWHAAAPELMVRCLRVGTHFHALNADQHQDVGLDRRWDLAMERHHDDAPWRRRFS